MVWCSLCGLLASAPLAHSSSFRVPFMRKMGAWWVEAAVRGQVARLPLVNVVEHSQPPEQQNAARQH